MSWLIVAKIPLLISSRITSATLTDSRSASSLTVIVPGSSIAPRSRGSIVWTDEAFWSGRRGGLRGPRRPRVPLLLLATGSSLGRVRGGGSGGGLREECRWELGLERPGQGAFADGYGQAIGVVTHVCASTRESPGRIEHDVACRGADDASQVTLGTGRATCHARPGRNPAYGQRTGRGGRPAYVATSSVGAASGAFAVSAVPSDDASVPSSVVLAAAFFVV